MKIARFTRGHCATMRDEINEALKQIGEKYGISLKTGDARYSDSNITFKLELSLVNQNGQVITRDAENLKTYAPLLGLGSDPYGKQFVSNGKVFKLVGYKPQSPKYPFIAQCIQSGQQFKFTEQAVKHHLTK